MFSITFTSFKMLIFPPYKKWTVLVNDPRGFENRLKKIIEYQNTNRNAPLIGKIHDQGFSAVIKENHKKNIAEIKGVISTNSNGVQMLTLTIESSNFFPILTGVFSVLFITISIIQLNPWALLAIPGITVWLGFIIWMMHLKCLDKTKEAMFELIEIAKK